MAQLRHPTLSIRPPQGGLPSLVIGERLDALERWVNTVYIPYIEKHPRYRPKWLTKQFGLMGYGTLAQMKAICNRPTTFIHKHCTHIFLPRGFMGYYCLDEALRLKDGTYEQALNSITFTPREQLVQVPFYEWVHNEAVGKVKKKTHQVRRFIAAAKLAQRLGVETAFNITGVYRDRIRYYMQALAMASEEEVLKAHTKPYTPRVQLHISSHNRPRPTKGTHKKHGVLIIE